jgi:hypothetical protein
MSNETIIYRHTGEPSPCGGVAFHLDAELQRHEVIKAAHVTYPDGSKPAAGELVRCGHCGLKGLPWSAFTRSATVGDQG